MLVTKFVRGPKVSKMAWYYTFNGPEEINGVPNLDTKPGIVIKHRLPINRLGKYQLPFGRNWEAHYTWLCYHEDPEIITWIEDSVLGHFRQKAFGVGAGMTEWVINTTWQEIREYVLLICRDNNITIRDFGPGPWNPVRIEQEIANSL